MLVLSDNVMAAFLDEGLAKLRQTVLSRWLEQFRAAGDLVGDDGRAAILTRIEGMARANPKLTVADLSMLADLMLVDAANTIRQAVR